LTGITRMPLLKEENTMGMSGYYIAVDDALLQDVIDGAQSVLGIDPSGEKTLDIDKSWQGIHQLLCGEPFEGDPPMGYVVPLQYDNRIESESDFGAFYITPSEVKEAADFLSTLDDDALRDMYGFDSMRGDGTYPITAEDDAEEFYSYLHSYLLELISYFKKNAEEGKAVIFYIL